jgi:hypothetical protein
VAQGAFTKRMQTPWCVGVAETRKRASDPSQSEQNSRVETSVGEIGDDKAERDSAA